MAPEPNVHNWFKENTRNVYYGRDPVDAAHPSLQRLTQQQRNYLASTGLTTSSAHHMPAAPIHQNQETAGAVENQETAEAVENQETDSPVSKVVDTDIYKEIGAAENEEIKTEENPEIGAAENEEIKKEENPEIGAAENEDIKTEENPEIGAAENEEIKTEENPETKAVENEEMAAPIQELEMKLGDEAEFPNLKRFGKITKKERRGEFQR